MSTVVGFFFFCVYGSLHIGYEPLGSGACGQDLSRPLQNRLWAVELLGPIRLGHQVNGNGLEVELRSNCVLKIIIIIKLLMICSHILEMTHLVVFTS